MSAWNLRVYERQQLVYSVEVCGAAELGRQSEGEGKPYFQDESAGRKRVVIARLDEDSVSRKHALVEPLPAGRIRLTNLSSKLTIRLPDGNDLRPAASCELTLPASLLLGKKVVRLQPLESRANQVHSLEEVTLPPGQFSASSRLSVGLSGVAGLEMERMVRWLQAAVDVLQCAVSTSDFLARAARAVVEMVGLDSGHALLIENGQWRTAATHLAPLAQCEQAASAPIGGFAHQEPEWHPSRQILGRVCQEKKVFWEVPNATATDSLAGVKAVVAAPILNRQGEVIGILYGDRRNAGVSSGGPINRLEAGLVSLLASSVAAGLARLEQEQATLRARVQFEQFFTPELSRHLEAEPRLLDGRELEITVLFCDIRRFSRACERLGPEQTSVWARDVLGTLSRCVLSSQGALIDYVGDELLAMWGAPIEQPDHALRACRAALEMLERLPQLSERWKDILQEPLDLGIGINTGIARVGNVGSDVKFKYGPLGNTVNVGSRVQGATKFLKSRLLITGSTFSKIGNALPTRRLCRVRTVNIIAPVDLYELPSNPSPSWFDLKTDYESALVHLEKKQFRQAARILGRLLADHPSDGPILILNSRVAQYLLDDPEPFDPTWDLPGK